MARKALKVKCEKQWKKANNEMNAGKKVEKSTRLYNRCKLCGRNRGYMRKFEMCRICVRQLASKGEINGLTKSSW
ncbi:MAG: 30S ribosomal protein S14 type Z [Candidatus Peregrinibacteria bacterium GW2011_GWA2_33_10]|nr:MAG: 30S ribosomal protein S14 type Z [Candidatus Peregrinibacteria bacterium GW2011_GWA2_33_10]KKP39900.1 MAG: 30S ribosomal protein S14, small subunit ribosomal protein S14 [Candidatus Peregrinibacteria bacterium GW2011_GWC2_33_13]